ncbi:MAG: hypothetical protein ACYC8T_28190 [Myxococcaceae bacterium]
MRARALLLMWFSLCGCRAPAVPPSPPPIVATCAVVSGEVHFRRPGQVFWALAGTGSLLLAGTWVKTGKDSYARVEFVGGGTLELEESAVVVIDIAPAPADAGGQAAPLVAIKSGEVHGTLGGESPSLVIRNDDGSHARLTPADDSGAVEYRLSRGELGTFVSVIAGEATVGAAEVDQQVVAGQSTQVTAAGPAALEQLIAFPQSLEPGVDAHLRCGDGQPVRLAWRQVSGASGYRVEMAGDLSFTLAIERRVSLEPRLSLAPASPGVFAWRVAARDPQGRYGEYGFARRVFCEAQPAEDLLLAPENLAQFGYAKAPPAVTFSWRPAAGAPGYRLVVASAPDLMGHLLLEQESAEPMTVVDTLEPGDYYWGVYEEDDGESLRPLFLEPRRLTVRKVSATRVQTLKSIKDWGE